MIKKRRLSVVWFVKVGGTVSEGNISDNFLYYKNTEGLYFWDRTKILFVWLFFITNTFVKQGTEILGETKI